MNHRELQERLAALGYYDGKIDAIYGRLNRAAVMEAMTDGPDTKLRLADLAASAHRLKAPLHHVRAVDAVESAGAGFADGRPIILFEPHRFSRATKGAFDQSNPGVSYPKWDRARYPRTQEQRYAQLVEAVGLNVDAGFASASYGRFQILGENFRACGFRNPFEFANAMAFDEAAQLLAFEKFIVAAGLLPALRKGDWATFARGYNGTAYKKNAYDRKLAEAYERLRSKGVARPYVPQSNDAGTQVLRIGMRGEAVANLQQMLTAHGYPTRQDGIFCAQTLSALKRFQKEAALEQDGVVGVETRKALEAANVQANPLPGVWMRLKNLWLRDH